MKNSYQIFSLIVLSSLISCGSDDSGSSNKSSRDQAEAEAETESTIAAADGSSIQGKYIAKFVTVNPHVVGTIPGSAQIMRDENKLSAFVRLFAGSPSIAHFQNVHKGTRCPDMRDDANGDGYLDYQETLKASGPVLIPLDWDIGSQLAANRSWPKAFPNGSYEYMKFTNFDRFWNDLKETDRNPDDDLVKLAPDEGITVSGMVVIIQGVDANKNLPDSVAGYGRWKNYQTLPIACGVFEPFKGDTGVVFEEGIPGPVAPVEEGQDRPAPEGEDEIPGSGTIIVGPSNDAGSNDSDSEDEEENRRPAPVPSPDPLPETDSDETSDDDGICWPWENDC